MAIRTMGFVSFLAAIVTTLTAGVSAKPAFTQLLNNPRWYRTYDSSSSIIPAEGKLLFAWDFVDPDKQVDSFFVGIDTLWGLPQDMNGDTASDWDLQVCPDEICMNGLKAGIHGANSPYPFGVDKSKAEHHMQFFPAISPKFEFIAPARSLFGAMMFCRSRSTGASDTVLAYGSWKLAWDSTNPPPVRPIKGYLPKVSDFVIVGDTVRYLQGAAGMLPRPSQAVPISKHLGLSIDKGDLRAAFPSLKESKEIEVYGSSGRRIWSSGQLGADCREINLHPGNTGPESQASGFLLIRLSWQSGEEWSKAPWLAP